MNKTTEERIEYELCDLEDTISRIDMLVSEYKEGSIDVAIALTHIQADLENADKRLRNAFGDAVMGE